MTDPVRLTARLNSNSQFAERVAAKGARSVKAKMNSVRSEALQEMVRIINAEMVTDRPPNRRKKYGTYPPHLVNLLRVEVNGGPNHGFPIEIRAYSVGDHRKVAALEYGSPRHLITGNPWLYFPMDRERAARWDLLDDKIVRLEGGKRGRGARPTTRARRQGYAQKKRWVKTEVVAHPGNREYAFMRRALKRTVERALRSG